MKRLNNKGFLGIHPLIWLAIVGAFALWAYWRGYIKWKGPSQPAEVAHEMAQDVRHSAKKLVK